VEEFGLSQCYVRPDGGNTFVFRLPPVWEQDDVNFAARLRAETSVLVTPGHLFAMPGCAMPCGRLHLPTGR